jgi:hypothetical protein
MQKFACNDSAFLGPLWIADVVLSYFPLGARMENASPSPLTARLAEVVALTTRRS